MEENERSLIFERENSRARRSLSSLFRRHLSLLSLKSSQNQNQSSLKKIKKTLTEERTRAREKGRKRRKREREERERERETPVALPFSLSTPPSSPFRPFAPLLVKNPRIKQTPLYLKTLHSTCSRPSIVPSSANMSSTRFFWAGSLMSTLLQL